MTQKFRIDASYGCINNRVVARYMGSGIKGLQEGGSAMTALGSEIYGLGIGISAVFHRIRDQSADS